jgi:DNA-binding XRE family transcriptional regulator
VQGCFLKPTVKSQAVKLKSYPCNLECRGCGEDCRGLAFGDIRGVYTLRIVIYGGFYKRGILHMTGAQIKSLRKALGYTQARLAEEVGVTANTIARYEREELNPSPPVQKLLKLLEMLVIERKAA